MKDNEPNPSVDEPVAGYGLYTYKDYLEMDTDSMVEIIKGRLFRMNAAPKRIHQKLSLHIAAELYQFLKRKSCEVYEAPFDVRFPYHSKKNEEIYTVVQPDICVVCDSSKLDDAGCLGAPDLVIEILSLGNNKKELQYKYEIYETSGVKEYWVIHPHEQTLLVYTWRKGKYYSSRLFISGDVVSSSCIPGFRLDLTELFDTI